MKFYIDYVWYGGDEYFKLYCMSIGDNNFILFKKKIREEDFKEYEMIEG